MFLQHRAAAHLSASQCRGPALAGSDQPLPLGPRAAHRPQAPKTRLCPRAHRSGCPHLGTALVPHMHAPRYLMWK